MQRKLMRMSQHDLAERLGVTFQQVQKYERGTNRVSASTLFGVAQFLGVPVGFFFEGIPGASAEPEASQAAHAMIALLTTPQGVELSQAFRNIPEGPLRERFLALGRALGPE